MKCGSLLTAAKTEFGQVWSMLEKVHKKLQEASTTVDQGLVRTRAIERKLRNVQELGSPEHPESTILEDEIEEVEHTVDELVSVS